MKNLIFFIFGLGLLACGQQPGAAVAGKDSAKTNAVSDSAAMAESIHRFYKWYEENTALVSNRDFIDESGPHPKLDLPKLGIYLNQFMQSQAVCTEFIQNETIFYRACSAGWKDAANGELLTCMDSDHYYCAQDWEAKEFQTAGVKVTIIQDGRAEVKLNLDPNGPNGEARDFEMKRENGKWLISKVGCL